MSAPTKDTGGPAFPINREQEGWYDPGMTLRDYFAAAALPSLLAGVPAALSAGLQNTVIIETASEAADAMLRERTR